MTRGFAEGNGDFWHANPLLYENKNLTLIQVHNVRKDKNRYYFLTKLGFHVCVVWESEINWNRDLVKEKITATRKTVNPPALHADYTAFDSPVADLDWSEKIKSLWFKKSIFKPKFFMKCDVCKKEFEVIQSVLSKRKYCSQKCCRFKRRKVERPSFEQLSFDLAHMTMVKMGEKYGVSDKTIKNWILRN